MTTYPGNLFATIAFIVVLGYIIWYSYRQAKQDEIKEAKRNEILFEGIAKAVKTGFKEAIKEMKEEQEVKKK